MKIINAIKRSPYLRLLVFFTAFTWFTKFSGSVIPLYLLKEGIPFEFLALGISASMIGQIFAIYIIARNSFRNKHI